MPVKGGVYRHRPNLTQTLSEYRRRRAGAAIVGAPPPPPPPPPPSSTSTSRRDVIRGTVFGLVRT